MRSRKGNSVSFLERDRGGGGGGRREEGGGMDSDTRAHVMDSRGNAVP